MAPNCTKNETTRDWLGMIIQMRTFKKGTRPLVGSLSENDAHNRWVRTRDPSKLNREEKGMVIEKMMEIILRTTFQTHVYMIGRENI